MESAQSTPLSAVGQSGALFEALFRANPVAMSVSSRADGRFVEVNEAFERLSGYSRAELVGRTSADVGLFPDPSIRQRALEALDAGNKPAHVHFDLRTKSGRVCHVEATISPLRLMGEELVLVAGFDLAGHFAAETARRLTAEIQRQVMETVPGGMVQVGVDGFITAANAEAQRILGISPETVTGLSLAECARHTVHEDGTACGEAELPPARCLATGEAQPAAVLGFRRPDGETAWILCTAVPLPLPEGEGLAGALAVLLDVTRRREMEEERRHFETRLLDAQKAESLCLLAGGIAHDFNNLLVGILGNAGLALMDLDPTGPVHETVRDIELSARRAADLTRQLLAFSGGAVFSKRALDVTKLAEEMARLLANTLPPAVRLMRELDPHLPLVEADPTQLRQVLMSLISNAAEAIGDRPGIITVRTERVEATRAMLDRLQSGATMEPGLHVRLSVTDTGDGMDEETLRRIFDPFFTTKFTGRGLGLAAALGIVRGHGGAIGARSEVGRGTTLDILLPLASDEARGAGTGPARWQEANWPPPCTVLVIDDEEPVRQFAQRVLERQGFTVLLADDGDTGLAEFEKRREDIGVVMLDVTMPRLGGKRALAGIREIDAGARVVLMSGYNENEAIAWLRGHRPTAFMRKPFTPAQLADALRSALQVKPA